MVRFSLIVIAAALLIYAVTTHTWNGVTVIPLLIIAALLVAAGFHSLRKDHQ